MKEELEFWGVSAVHIEPCCWNTFNSWTSTMEFLRQLERDRKIGVCPGHGAYGKVGGRRETSRVAAFRLCVWGTLTNPTYSLGARVSSFRLGWPGGREAGGGGRGWGRWAQGVVCVGGWGGERERVCVCVCVRERERERVWG